MTGPTKWLPSSLAFFLIATAFSTVLVYSIPAEDPFVPALPEIPPPRAQNQDSLYRDMMQNRKKYPEQQNQKQRSQPTSVFEDNSKPEGQQQIRPSQGEEVKDTEITKKQKTPVTESAPEKEPTRQAQNKERTWEKPNQVNKRNDEKPTGSTETKDNPEANSDHSQPNFLNREKEQEDFQSQKENIASLLSRDMLENTTRALKGLEDQQPKKKSKDSKEQKNVDHLLRGIDPVMPRNYKYNAPVYYKGIYMSNYVARTPSRYGPLLKQAKATGINTLVVDVQPRIPPEKFIQEARSQGFYLVSRVVVFEGGLKTFPAPEAHLNKVRSVAVASAQAGFMEIQLDYIRFADNLHIKGLTMNQRYRTIASVLQSFEQKLRPHGVRIGADIFGRIPFNNNDIIGQKMEVFSRYMDTLYPMLYPSHFYGDPFYQKNPYRTIYDGKTRAIKRAGTSRIIAYIQGFTMLVGKSGLSYKNYIKKQIEASRDSGGAGFIVWNPKNDYRVFFQALKETN